MRECVCAAVAGAVPVRECVCAAYAEFLIYCLDFSPYSLDFHSLKLVRESRDAELGAYSSRLVGVRR